MPAEQLEIEIAKEKKNPLLGRTELILQVRHSGAGTPNRQLLRAEIGRVSKATPERVYIRRIITDYGAGISECTASVYETPQLGEAVEQEYLRKRNAPKTEKEKAAETATPAPPTTAEAPTPPAPPSETIAKPAEPIVKPAETKREPASAEEKPAEAATKTRAPRKKPGKEKAAEAKPPEATPAQSEDKKSSE